MSNLGQFRLEDLERIISERQSAASETSYTKSLLQAGAERISKKFGEEAIEFIIAAVQGDSEAFRAEAADVLYHLLVLMRCHDISLESVLLILQERTAQSGIAEKAGRAK